MKVINLEKIYRVSIVVYLFSFMYSCSGTHFLQEGQMLYTGARVKIETDSISKKERKQLVSRLESNLFPKPNSSFLGLRPRLYIYNIVKKTKKNEGFRHWLKYKVGEPPVLLNDVDMSFNRDNIVNQVENKGYLNTKARYDTIVSGKKVKVEYVIQPGKRYVISKVNYPEDSSTISRQIQNLSGKSLLKRGDPFDLDIIIAERNRIDNSLKEKGFYYFHPSNIVVQADSTVAGNKVELNVRVKDNIPMLSKRQFTIDKTIVFADYNLQNNSDFMKVIKRDTIGMKFYRGFYIVDPENKFKPRVFDRTLYFHKGELYNRTDHNLTLNRLISLGIFKFVRNQFVLKDSLQNKFDNYYMLTPREFKSIRLELSGKTNSANYVGSEPNLNWSHRNLFGGAEHLDISVHGGFDSQIGSGKKGNNIYRFGTDVAISFPRIVTPFSFRSSGAFVPRTNAKLGYEFMNRTQLYRLHNFNAFIGYQWREDSKREHSLKLTEIMFVTPQNISDRYKQQMVNDAALQHVVEKQLIFGPGYDYTFTNTMLPNKHTFYYNVHVDLSANITGLLMGANVKKGKQKSILGVPFSQYAKTDHDFRYYMKMGEKSMIATRFIAGVAFPYGNSEYIPFSKQFFVGGSNSIRAFRAKALGPGSYDPRGQISTFLHDQTGDIRLELNTEYRANLYKFLNLAVFVDAGNIWLLREDFTRPGSRLTKNFMSEIAIGVGLGFRFDFNILILRTDLAIPVRIPYYPIKDRWMFNKIDFRSTAWRRDNLMLNIAIGYPF